MMAGIKEPETSMETAVAAVLGLLAFILGFYLFNYLEQICQQKWPRYRTCKGH
jgi:hypothetical protein